MGYTRPVGYSIPEEYEKSDFTAKEFCAMSDIHEAAW
jgi:hypothetical protein